MEYYSIWEHGNAAKIESPEVFDLIKNYGWGTDVYFHTPQNFETLQRKTPCWFHVPIATRLPLGSFNHHYLLSAEILFNAINVEITKVHIYDGSKLIRGVSAALDDNQLFSKDSNIDSIEQRIG